MLSEKLKPFNISMNDIITYFQYYQKLTKKYKDENLTYISSKINLNSLIVSFLLNFNKEKYIKNKYIFGVLNIEDEMYVLIYNNNECQYGAVKIQDNDKALFYEVIINYDNEKYQASHTDDKIEEHGFLDIKNIYDSLPNNIRDVKFETREDGIIQNYLLAYIPVEAVENDIGIKDTNKNKFRCKYKVPLRLENNNGNVLEFYMPTAHPISKDDKNDFIIC